MKNCVRIYIFSALVLSFFLMGCGHLTPQTDFLSCYQWASHGEVKNLRENWDLCKKSNNANATSLLMLAANHDEVEVMDFLYSRGVDLNETDLMGDTALTYAASSNRHKSLVWLIEHGASPESFRPDKITALMILLQQGGLESIHYLLSKPFNINAPMTDGWTPLFFAVRREDKEVLKKLLKLGADSNWASKTGETPLDLATDANWIEGISLLKLYKARKGKR